MPAQVITAPTFRLLEDELLHDILAVTATPRGILAPKFVVTPNSTLALHLRVRITRAAGFRVATNLNILSLPAFARNLSINLRQLPFPDHDNEVNLILMHLIHNLPAQSPLAPLRDIPNGFQLLLPVIRDLAEAGFTPENPELEILRAIAEEPDITPKDRAILNVYQEICQFLQAHPVPFSPFRLAQLASAIETASKPQLYQALGAENDQSPQLWIYGFYEWLDVHLQWLTALAERLTVKFFYPLDREPGGNPHPAFLFAAPVLQHLQSRLPHHSARHLSPPPDEPIQNPTAFLRGTFPEGALPTTPPPFLSVQTASSPRAEAIAAAVQVRRWLEPPHGLAPRDILIVAADADGYAATLQDVFTDFAIPLRVSDVPITRPPEFEPLRSLIRLWRDHAPTEWLLDHLQRYPDIPATDQIDVVSFTEKIRTLNLWGGEAWRRLALQLSANAPNERTPFTDAEQRLITHILAFVPTEPEEQFTPAQVISHLENLACTWLPDPTLLAPTLRSLANVKSVIPDLTLSIRQWCNWLEGSVPAVTQTSPPTDAVWFLPLMRARGVTTRGLIWLGLAHGKFPPPLADETMLSERASNALARAARDAGHWFPQKSRLTEEMMLLFWLVNTSAERIHWITPTADFDGKALAPTPWVQRYRERWRNNLEPVSPTDIPRSPKLQAIGLLKLDPNSGAFVPPTLAPFLGVAFAQILAELCTPDSPQPTPSAAEYLGRSPAISFSTWPRSLSRTLAVTALEDLAKCPLRFYASRIMRWEPLLPIQLTQTINAISRGTLLHELLAQMVKSLAPEKRLDTIIDYWLNAPAQTWRKILDQAIAAHPEVQLQLAILPESLREATRQELLSIARRYWQHVGEDETFTDVELVDAEVEFTRDYPGLIGWKIIGKIDRIDSQFECRWHLYDFKTGKAPTSLKKLCQLGWLIQATLYPWLTNHPRVTFSYVYLGSDPPVTREIEELDEPPLLESIRGFIEHRWFPPFPREVLENLTDKEDPNPCQHCRCISICRRFEPRRIQATTRLWRTEHTAIYRTKRIQKIFDNEKKPTSEE